MKAKILMLTLLIAATSCKTVKTGTAKSIDISGVGVIHTPVVADLEVSQQKTSKTITLKKMESLEAAKRDIIRDLLSDNNADLFVEPKFQSVTKNGKTELTVTGWLAYYKNFRTIKEEDLKVLEIRPAVIHRVETSQPSIIEKIKK